MSIEAIKHYEAALKEAFPRGATGDVFEHWNKARIAIAEAEKQVSYSGNGSAGRENMTAPTGFFFQMPKAEKQEPVACPYPCGWDNLFSIIIKKGAYLATSTLGDEEPLSDHQRQEMMLMIDYAKTLASWGKNTHPQPKREWVGLTDDEEDAAFEQSMAVRPKDASNKETRRLYAQTIEAKLKEKNT